MRNALHKLLGKGARLVISADARRDSAHEIRRRLQGEPTLPGPQVGNLLVICHGNLCRSPFAAALLANGLPGVEVRSAGLEAASGDPVDHDALRAAALRGVNLSAHRTRRVSAEDVAWAHLILGMQGHHATLVARRWPEARKKTRLLGHFLPEPPFEIDDPWGQSDEVFEHTFRRVEAAVERLAARLRHLAK